MKGSASLIILFTVFLFTNAKGQIGIAVAQDENGSSIKWQVAWGKEKYPENGAAKTLKEMGFKKVSTLTGGEKDGHFVTNGYYVVVKTTYKNYEGKMKTSFGLGASSVSYSEAEERALINLSTYDWVWTKRLGYSVVRKGTYNALEKGTDTSDSNIQNLKSSENTTVPPSKTTINQSNTSSSKVITTDFIDSDDDDWITKENSGYGPWSSWIDIGNGMKFRYSCKKEPYKGTWQTYFEFIRTDRKEDRTQDRLYAHAELTIEGYDKKVRIGIIDKYKTDYGKDRDRVWHPLPFRACDNGLKYTYRTGFSRYSTTASVFEKRP